MSKIESKFDRAVAAVGREIGMRKRVYPRWVADGRMQPAKAKDEIEAMEEAYGYLKQAQEAERKRLEPQAELPINPVDPEEELESLPWDAEPFEL